MKIVTPAKEREPYWLHAHDLECPECKIAFRVEPGDHVAHHQPAGKRRGVWLACPRCGRGLDIWEGDPPVVSAR